MYFKQLITNLCAEKNNQGTYNINIEEDAFLSANLI